MSVRQALIILLLIMPQVKTSYAATTADIISTATTGVTSRDCLDYCVTGICITLNCSLLGCILDFSTLISHRSPDLVVTAYKDPGENAWDEATVLYGEAARTAANAIVNYAGLESRGGSSNTARHDEDNNVSGQSRAFSNLFFKEASVIGSPTSFVTDEIEGNCPSESIPFVPYFQSEFDAFEWRWGFLEKLYPSTWIPWFEEISQTPLTTWGGLHPRMGFIKSEHPARAAAVAAQRSVDIMTKKRQPHVYLLQNFPDGPSFESDYRIDKWQMVSPVRDNTCYTFGKANDYVTGRVEDQGKYAFLYWQKLECCPFAEGTVIQKIRTPDMCI